MAEVKRGYRKVTAIIPVATYELLKQQADDNDREVGQQAAFLLRKVLTVTAYGEAAMSTLGTAGNGVPQGPDDLELGEVIEREARAPVE